ncbi:hypothetical protein HON52_03915 [Candidatus Uhrbacteria bacterium]|nr:hypothetical protein [Candidatus Uhrbacteria bacterium]
MSKFDRDPRKTKSRPKTSFSDYSNGKAGRFGAGKKTSYRSKCSGCGNGCTVPFKPTGRKPVLCGSCFGGNRGREKRGGFDNKRSFGGSHDKRSSSSTLKSDISSINRKLDRIMELLGEKPSAPSRHSTPSRTSRPSRPAKSSDDFSFDN